MASTDWRTQIRLNFLLGVALVGWLAWQQAALLAAEAAPQPVDLRCEYLVNPLGIDELQPRLSWKLQVPNPKQRGARQTAYQVLVASSPEILARDRGDLWDSGKVETEQSIQVEYAGRPLVSEMNCFWKVRIGDQEARTAGWSQPAVWSMGLLKPEDWKGKWIGLDSGELLWAKDFAPAKWIWFEKEAATDAPAEARFFRRVFTLPSDARIIRAVLSMTADDSFSLWVNGREAAGGRAHWNPRAVDITALLQPGKNLLAVQANLLAVQATNARGPAGLLGALRIEFDRGNPMVMATDAEWRTQKTEAEGWNTLSFDDSGWPAAAVLGGYDARTGAMERAEEHRRLPARMLRREFQVEKPIRRATAQVCGLGCFELYLNGQKVDDHVMDPTLSNTAKRTFYVTFDVTKHLRPGTNAAGVWLGNGRFFSPRNKGEDLRNDPTHTYPQMLLAMRIEYNDGTAAEVVSDENWKITDRGPLRVNSEYDGEEYDARMEQDGWAEAGFNDDAWQKAQLVSPPGGKLIAQMMEPMRVVEVLRPVAITNPKPGMYLADFGQNLYGMVRLKLRGPAGTRVQLRESFTKKPDGTIKMEDNRTALSTDVYICRGKREETWSPRFRGQGTHFVEITGFPGRPTADNFEFLVVHTDLERVGEFSCSNELLNQILANVIRSTRMQERSVPMDPDRDERQAWLGHPAKTSESEGYLYQVASFYQSFLGECRIDQREDGDISDSGSIWPYYSADAIWPAVVTILPDWFSRFYGDRRILEKNYPMMKKWMLYLEKKRLLPNATLDHGAYNYGDWVEAGSMDDDNAKEFRRTSDALISSAYFHHNCRLLSQIARTLGKADDERYFADLAAKTAAGFQKRFFDREKNKYERESQFSYVLPLAFDLVPADRRQAVITNLVDEIMGRNHGHLGVGLIGMQWYMQTLAKIGRMDVAYTVATQTTRPSWGYMVSKGGTSIWERWNQDTCDPGMNGESQLILAGDLTTWYFKNLAGIGYDPQQPGFKHIILRPRPVGDLQWVNASHVSLYGKTVSRWKIEGSKFHWDITVPPNTTATVYVPAKNAATVTEGGKPAEKSPGLKFLRSEDGAAVFSALSGEYSFTSSAWR